ncbi:MAG: IS3 family transposase [Gammaproteobacteria bacterium]|nr:IS3 family transposase [Gammaproteobacteria bacterium]
MRRACELMPVARSSLDYQSRPAEKDTPVIAEMCRLAGQYPRFGYRRIHVFLRRAGHVLGADRTYRLWRQAGLHVSNDTQFYAIRRHPDLRTTVRGV